MESTVETYDSQAYLAKLQRINATWEDLRQRYTAELSLHSFVKQAWPYMEPKNPFIDGWYLHALCEHLEALARRDIKNLLVNLPFRMGKSLTMSVALPAWIWIHDPAEKFLCSSFAMSLSQEHSILCRRLIMSDWYQARWGDRFSLESDQNAKRRFDNDRGGYRMATSVGGAITGSGGSFLICDDPNNVKDGESEVRREGVNMWWDRVWSTRRNDVKTSARLLTQQRTSEQDVSGHLINGDEDKEWVILRLPMEYEIAHKCVTVVIPSTNGKKWEDPRTKEKELLFPERIDEKELRSLKAGLKTEYAIAGQLQQRPSPEEGGIIKKHWFKWWKQPAPPRILQTIQSWDTALEHDDTKSSTNAFSACTTWGIFNDDHNISNLILLSIWSKRVPYYQLREVAQRLYYDYRDDGTNNNFKADGNHQPDLVLVEAKASGHTLIQDFKRAGIPAIRFDPAKYGDRYEGAKTFRAKLVSHLIQGGRVWVPARPPDYTSLRTFADYMVEKCAVFPNDTESRDLVDTMTQVLIRLSSIGMITNPSDEDYSDTSVKFEQPLYY